MNVEALKKQAAIEAVNEIKDEKIIGLGTGSTTRYAVEEIGLRLKDGRLKDIVGIATSENTRELVVACSLNELCRRNVLESL